MASIAPPSKKAAQSQVIGLNSTEKTPPSNLKPLQFKVAETLKNEYKAFAAAKGKDMTTLFLQMYAEYKVNHD